MQAKDLTEARELLADVARLLREANAKATAVQSLLTVPLIAAAAELTQRVINLQCAIREDAPPASDDDCADVLPHGFSTRAGSL